MGAVALLVVCGSWATGPSRAATLDYEAAISAYLDGQADEAVRALIQPALTRGDAPQRAVRRYVEALHQESRAVLELAPRLRAMAAAHTEAYLRHARHRDTIPARWHYRAAIDALDTLDWMARADPRANAGGFRQVVHDTHAHQLAVLGDHDRLIEFGAELQRAGYWSADVALAIGSSFERRARDVPTWALASERRTFGLWRVEQLRLAERALEQALDVAPNLETVHLRLAAVRLDLGRPDEQAVPPLRRLAAHAESRAVRYLAHLFLARWHEVHDRAHEAVAAYVDAMGVGHGPSACVGLQYHAVMGVAGPACPEQAARAADPWAHYLSGDVERLDALTLRLREAGS